MPNQIPLVVLHKVMTNLFPKGNSERKPQVPGFSGWTHLRWLRGSKSKTPWPCVDWAIPGSFASHSSWKEQEGWRNLKKQIIFPVHFAKSEGKTFGNFQVPRQSPLLSRLCQTETTDTDADPLRDVALKVRFEKYSSNFFAWERTRGWTFRGESKLLHFYEASCLKRLKSEVTSTIFGCTLRWNDVLFLICRLSALELQERLLRSDALKVRGVWRRSTLESFLTTSPAWEVSGGRF